jgi:hypothetical protein
LIFIIYAHEPTHIVIGFRNLIKGLCL